MVLKEGMGRLKKPLAFSIEGEWLTEQVGLWIERAVRVVRKRGCGDRQNQTPNSQSVPRVCVCTRACLTACTIPSETGCSCSRRVPEKKKGRGSKTKDRRWSSVLIFSTRDSGPQSNPLTTKSAACTKRNRKTSLQEGGWGGGRWLDEGGARHDGRRWVEVSRFARPQPLTLTAAHKTMYSGNF